jgi:uncharacterized MAPEG superfamily protein
MTSPALSAYVLAVVVLFVKFVATTLVQAHVRLSTKAFQYPEDAAHWGGVHVGEEADRVVRAQRLLRNDAEGQPLFLALGGCYVALGASPEVAPLYFGAYVSCRLVHAYYFLRPRQPHRNRAFGAGMLVLLAIAVHATVAAIARVS